MVVIRLARNGSKKNPFYNLVVADRRNPRDGRFIERVGFYDPLARGRAPGLEGIEINHDKVDAWIKKGAKPSERVRHLIEKHKKLAANPDAAIIRPTKAEQRKAQSEASIKQAKTQLGAEVKTAEDTE